MFLELISRGDYFPWLTRFWKRGNILNFLVTNCHKLWYKCCINHPTPPRRGPPNHFVLNFFIKSKLCRQEHEIYMISWFASGIPYILVMTTNMVIDKLENLYIFVHLKRIYKPFLVCHFLGTVHIYDFKLWPPLLKRLWLKTIDCVCVHACVCFPFFLMHWLLLVNDLMWLFWLAIS